MEPKRKSERGAIVTRHNQKEAQNQATSGTRAHPGDPALKAPKVNTAPGAAYGDDTRLFQGIPGIERAANGRLWALWYAGGPDEPGDVGGDRLRQRQRLHVLHGPCDLVPSQDGLHLGQVPASPLEQQRLERPGSLAVRSRPAVGKAARAGVDAVVLHR